MPERKQEHNQRNSPNWLWLLGVAFILVLFLPGIGGIPYPSADAQYSDMAITHYPNAIFLRQSLQQDGQIPLWSPLIYSGYPFFAHPLSGLWYPPGWLALLFPLPLGFNLVVLLHLIWGAWGMLKFLSALGLCSPATIFGALAFALMPKLIAHYGAGHLTLVYALCWLPWLLWAVLAEPKRFAWLGSLFWALTFLADVRWGVYAGLLWAAYSLFQGWRKQRQASSSRRMLTPLKLGLQGIVGLGLAAPLAWPLIELTRLSNRTSLSVEDFFEYSLPPGRLLAFLFPDFGGFHEWVLYSGALVFFLALALLLVWKISSETLFWLATLALSTLFALGENLPGIEWLAALPGISLLRVPARALFFTQFSLILLASITVDRLSLGANTLQQKRLFLLMFGLATLVLLLWIGIFLILQTIPPGFLWGGAVILAGMGWILLMYKINGRTAAWGFRLVMGILMICLLDWYIVDRSLFVNKPASTADEAGWAAQVLSQQSGKFRVYSPSYSLPQHTAAEFGLEFASGVDPVQLLSYAAFMQPASGVPGEGYRVSLPPFSTGDPQSDNRDFEPQADLLGLLNVRYVLSAFPLETPGLQKIAFQEESYLYENQLVRPRAWVELDGQVSSQIPRLVHTSPNRLLVQAQGPGLLVLSEIDYPGWHAYLDGERVNIQAYQGLFRAVVLPQGEHEVRFIFRPSSLTVGLAIFFATVFGLAIDTVFRRQRQAGGHA